MFNQITTTRTAIRTLATLGLASLLAACASAPAAPSAPQDQTPQASNAATHYWQAKRQANESDYNRDNSQCGQLNQISTDNPMAYDSDSFESYRQCMIERGYVLRTY